MSNKEHSCIKCPVACVVAGPYSPRFLSMGILERMLLQESLPPPPPPPPPHNQTTNKQTNKRWWKKIKDNKNTEIYTKY